MHLNLPWAVDTKEKTNEFAFVIDTASPSAVSDAKREPCTSSLEVRDGEHVPGGIH